MSYHKQPLDEFTVWLRAEIKQERLRTMRAAFLRVHGRCRQTPHSPSVPTDDDTPPQERAA